MIWKLIDRDTDPTNSQIEWAFNVGDQVKIRLVNDLAQNHPMHHLFHIQGAGRFLVMSRDVVPEPTLVSKNTVFVRSNQTADIRLSPTQVCGWPTATSPNTARAA